MSWADRIAYLCHDFEDAVLASVVSPDELPAMVAERCGRTRRSQLHAFIDGLVRSTVGAGRVSMADDLAEALTAFRAFNYERIYLREESRRQARVVDRLLGALVEWYVADPARLVAEGRTIDDATDPVREAVAFVGGMTDRFAHERAIRHLDWSADDLPIGLDSE